MAKSSKKEQPVDHRVIIHDGFDEMAFEGVQHYERIEQICNSSEATDHKQEKEENKLASDLVQDVFTSFYRAEPIIDEEKQSLTKDVMGQLLEMKEYKDFHGAATLDSVASALGTIQMSPVLLEKLKEIKEQIEKQREQQREQNKKDGKEPGEGVPSGAPGLDELDDQSKSELRQSMRQALDKANEENEEMQAQMRHWGMDKGAQNKMDPKSRLELSDRLKQAGKLKNMSQLMGRLKNVINAALATIPSHGQDEIVSIGQGDALDRLVPSELLKLEMQPEQFYVDFIEKKLLIYDMKGVENLGKGPLIYVFDRSGSMSGGREELAVAMGLSLMHYAQSQGRAFAWIAFDHEVHAFKFYAKGETATIDEKLEFAEIGAGGGTDFWAPLSEAMRQHALEPELKPADIIFATDGECRVEEDNLEIFNTWKKEKMVRLFGIGIADGSHYEHASFQTLEQFSDQVCMINSLGDVTALREAVQMSHQKRGSDE